MVKDFIAGIDIGGTKIALAIARKGGEILAGTSFRTDGDVSPEAAMTQALETLEGLAATHHGRLAAIGIGCPGPLDLERGRVLSPPNMPSGWYQFPLRSMVEGQSSLPVIVENDANAAALGEHLYGAGRGYSDLVYLTISTGIGGGIIADNRLVHRDGEAGHVTVQPGGAACGCGARGCLEALCSGTAIARRAQEYLSGGKPSKLREMVSDVQQITAKTVEDAVRAGDELARLLWRETISLLAVGIGSIIAVVAPQAVILGGGVTIGAGELLLGPLRDELKERVCVLPKEVRILQAGLGTDSGLYGALALASPLSDLKG